MAMIVKSPKILCRDKSIYEYLGLSDYEARIYDFLVKEGPSTARKISALCGVPRTKVYGVLKKIIERDMVKEIPSNPKKFIALPPNEVFKYILKSQRMIIKSFNEIISNLQRDYEKSKALSNTFRGEFWIFTEAEGPGLLSEKLLHAKRKVKVDIMISWRFFISFYNIFNKILDILADRKVRVQLCFTSNSEIDRRVCRNMGLCYKIVNFDSSYPIILLKIDDEFLLMYIATDDKNPLSNGIWILSQSRMLCNLLNRVFFKNIKHLPLKSPLKESSLSRGLLKEDAVKTPITP
jgi:sugar-specific transcriptional regulator TrmB